MRWHTARDDAMAAAALLRYILTKKPIAVRLDADHVQASRWTWPSLPCGVTPTVQRTPIGHVEPHFLARLVERIPRDEEPAVDAYFAMLDDALLDRQISASEAHALIDVAHQLGLHKSEVLNLHHSYLRALARAVWANGVLTKDERHGIDTVATLLGLDVSVASKVLSEEKAAATAQEQGNEARRVNLGGLALRPGDKVVLTGTMRRSRREIEQQALNAGLRVIGSVSKQTRVLAAADPNSLSGKAKDARTLAVPVVGEEAFMRALNVMSSQL